MSGRDDTTKDVPATGLTSPTGSLGSVDQGRLEMLNSRLAMANFKRRARQRSLRSVLVEAPAISNVGNLWFA
jgi:hypothetical protein